MHWRLPTEHVASGPFSSDERLKPAPVGSATGANRPYGVSSAPRTTEPLTSAEVAQLYWDPRELIGFTERSTTTLSTLQSKLERTPERGHATDEGEVHRAGYEPERGQGPGTGQINTEGKVTGEVRSTVDQQGKVSAPQSIQLTGHQRGVTMASARRA